MSREARPPEAETATCSAGEAWERSAASLVPGLTILGHPDLDRIGERTLLLPAPQALSRTQPEFAKPGSETRRPLAHRAISRKPMIFTPDEGSRSMTLTRSGSPTSVEADGARVENRQSFSASEIAAGTVLLLGGQVALLLHLLDPVSSLSPAVPELIGESPEMVLLRQLISRVSDLDVPVLIRGETGTGKELVARAIHRASPRSGGPFVAVNMAAIPTTLAASELFGAARGAFTGADRERQGYFDRAEGGTLFLDEIGEAPPEVQALLLRALEEGEIQPVGAPRSRKTDVRLLSATDRDLERAIEAELFRSPLLHRLAGFTLTVPPLRERREDVGRLYAAFLRRELEAIGEGERALDGDRPWAPPSLPALLARSGWPGNVRQLANAVRQMVIAHRGQDRVPNPSSLEELLGPGFGWKPTVTRRSPETDRGVASPPPSLDGKPRRPAQITEDELVAALRAHRWRLNDAAAALGIPRSSLYHLIERTDRVRKASDLSLSEIEASRDNVGGSIARMADELEVSERALRRRMGQLGLSH